MIFKIYDSMAGEKREFIPLSADKVRIYGCGPTVYNKPHIGNMRTMLIYDMLFRTLRCIYPNVCFVRNITDVDDKIINSAISEGVTTEAISTKYTKIFHDEMSRIFCLKPTVEPRVTEYIPHIVCVIQNLLHNGHAYVAADGVYFDISTFKGYGRLSRRRTDEQIIGARVASDPNKKHAGDFVLWKLGDNDKLIWNSPWGPGRPGWHIECSAMCHRELGPDFDIHCGGEDLKFPHHANEIAQSLCAYPGSSFASYWMHVAFVMFGTDKMSKSLGNVVYLDDLLANDINPEVVRYNLLMTHYRKPLHITESTLRQAKEALNRMYDVLLRHGDVTGVLEQKGPFWGAICDDLNIPLALTELSQLVTAANSATDVSERTLLVQKMAGNAQFLGLLNHSAKQQFNVASVASDPAIMALIDARNEARKNKNFAAADRIRDELKAIGVEVMDSKDNSLCKK